MSKVIIYVRVSTKDQEREGYSIPAQLQLLRDYASKKKLRVLKEFQESESAGSAGRKSFQEMVQLIQSDKSIESVLVDKADRLYRNMKDQIIIADLIADLGISIHFVRDARVLCKNSRSTEKFVHEIEAAQARYYLANLSEEVRKGQMQKARQGKYPGGVVPIGYKRNRLTRGIEVDPTRSPIIRKLFELYTEGNVSIDRVHGVAVKSGLTYPKSDRVLARSEIERMLKKIFYTGKFFWGGQLYQGDHPAIVDPILFETVQSVFKRRTNGKFSKRNFTFSRLMNCGECGNGVTAEIKKNKYVYYHCTGYGAKHKIEYVSESRIDDQFARIVARCTIPHEWHSFMKACLDEEFKSRRVSIIQERDRLEIAKDKIHTDMRKAFQEKLDGTIGEDFFKSVYNEYQRHLDSVNYRLSNLEHSIDCDFDVAQKTIELSHQAGTLYLRANAEQKRKLLKTVLSNCFLNSVTLYPVYHKAFDILAKGVESNNMRRR